MQKFKGFLKYLGTLIVGFIMGFAVNYFYGYMNRPSLVYTYSTSSFSMPEINSSKKNTGFYIYFNGKEFKEKLYMTQIRIINDGGTVLERNDLMSEKDPVRISADGIDLYFIDENNTNKTSKIELNKKNGFIYINFNYLNPGDTINLQFLHKKEILIPNILGSFKSIKEIKYNDKNSEKLIVLRVFNGVKTFFKWFGYVIGIVMSIALLIMLFDKIFLSKEKFDKKWKKDNSEGKKHVNK